MWYTKNTIVSNLYELMNTFRDKEAIMNKDFVLDFVAGGMTYPVHTFIIPCVFQKSVFKIFSG